MVDNNVSIYQCSGATTIFGRVATPAPFLTLFRISFLATILETSSGFQSFVESFPKPEVWSKLNDYVNISL